jgi:hypothetical protein
MRWQFSAKNAKGFPQSKCFGNKEARYLVPILKAIPLHASAELIVRRIQLFFFRMKRLVHHR